MIEWLIPIITIISICISIVSTFYCIKFGLLLLSLEDDIESSLDELDNSYQVMTEILKKPIFFDSIEVRECVQEIKNSRMIVINIANRLTSFGKVENIIIGESLENESSRKEKNEEYED